MRRVPWVVAAIGLGWAASGNGAQPAGRTGPKAAQAREPDEVVVFKSTPQGELKLHVYRPAGWKAGDRRPAIVFWFGGGFANGSAKAFARQGAYFATRGLVAVCAEYRIKNMHGTEIDKCVEDARSAMRWVRSHAGRLGIDPEKIVASGGSAGGTLALCVALGDGPDATADDKTVSTRPCALVLFNPAQGPKVQEFARKVAGSEDEKATFGDLLAAIDRPRKNGPPTIMFFGTDDRLLDPSRDFCRKARDAGVRCEIWVAPGQKHAFFHGEPWYASTVRQADVFLGSLGYVHGEPTIETSAAGTLKRDSLDSETPAGKPAN
jgi:acetyl esterase